MRRDISPGLASLIIQMQVFFTIAAAAVALRERVKGFQIAAMVLALLGLAIIALSARQAATPVGLTLTLLAAASWAALNLIVKSASPPNMFGFIVWSSLFAAPPLLVCAVVFDGAPQIAGALRGAAAATWLAVLWQSFGNTLFGFGAWGWLLSRYPAATVTPLALLIPVFGLGSSALVLGEPLPPWKLLACGLIVAALAVNLVWPRLRSQRP
jgi:O-acetylserine/cysteine efflux transporter